MGLLSIQVGNGQGKRPLLGGDLFHGDFLFFHCFEGEEEGFYRQCCGVDEEACCSFVDLLGGARVDEAVEDGAFCFFHAKAGDFHLSVEDVEGACEGGGAILSHLEGEIADKLEEDIVFIDLYEEGNFKVGKGEHEVVLLSFGVSLHVVAFGFKEAEDFVFAKFHGGVGASS